MNIGMNGKRIWTEEEVLDAAKEFADKEMQERNDTPGNLLWIVVHTLFKGRLMVEPTVMEACAQKVRELVIARTPEGGIMITAKETTQNELSGEV